MQTYTDGSQRSAVVPDDGKGAFVQRTTTGRGTLATSGMRLLWDLQQDGVNAEAQGRIHLYGLEMVYIPEGPFYVGDGISASSFTVTYINSPYMTNTVASGSGTIESPRMNLTAGMGRPYGISGSFTNLYPNGYNAYYIMKYELSRAGYLDFLNNITETQAATLRDYANTQNFVGTQNAISGSHPDFSNLHPWRAATLNAGSAPSYSGWREFFAWLDWAALRPMTEMEYEKAARGPLPPKPRDFPWGHGARHLANRFVNSNTPEETKAIRSANLISSGTYNKIFPNAPMRPGGLALPDSDQFEAGASYYGVLELAGNNCERTISSGTSAPKGFSGLHGDGTLNSDGTANVPDWPYPTEVKYGGTSVGVRGGNWESASRNCAISDRYRAEQNYYVSGGIRAVRSAPNARREP